ncbi:sugar ABC transporter substrate-binding protein [Paenibacillus sp. J22TS3]|nr:sugar ABC transporter substrate-binding protein [Paenibacillus sp. J22TS3]
MLLKGSKALMMLALVMVLILSACSGTKDTPAAADKPGETKAEPPKDEPVTLRVFSTFGGTDAGRAAFQKVLDHFTAKHPNVTIDNDVMSANDNGFRTKVNTDMNSGNEPDLLFYFVGADAEGFVKAGKVIPMNELLDADADWKNGFKPDALKLVQQKDGNIYAIPLTGFYEGLFVNKAIFEKHKLELPTDWAKLKTAVKTLASKGITPISAPFDQSHYLIENCILSAAGPDGHHKGLLSGIDPNWGKGLAGLKELYDLGAFPKDAATIDLNMAMNYYSEGLSAMIIEGSWAINSMSEQVRNTTTVLPFPAITGGVGSGKDIIGGFSTGFYMAKKTYEDTKKKDAAVALLKHLTSPESIKIIAESNGGTPAANVEVTGLPQVALDGFKMAADAPTINAPIDTQVSQETFTTIRENIQPVLKGTKTPEQALEEAKKVEENNKK